MNPSAGTLRTCFIQKDMCKFIGQQTFPGCICTWTRIRCSQCSDTCLYEIFSWCDSSVRWACAPCSHVESEQLKITHQHLHIHQSFPSHFNLGIFSFRLRTQVARKKEWKWWWSGSWLKRRIGGRHEDKNKTSCFNVSSKNIYSEQGESIIGKIKWSKF